MTARKKPALRAPNGNKLDTAPDGAIAMALDRSSRPLVGGGRPSDVTEGKIPKKEFRRLTTAERANRVARVSFAIMTREMVPTEVMIEYYLTILRGHDPFLKPDGEGGWYVWHDETKTLLSSPERRDAAMKFLQQAGHGMPAQAVYIDAEVRAAGERANVVDQGLLEGELDVRRLAALRDLLSVAGARDATTPTPVVIDAQSTDVGSGGT